MSWESSRSNRWYLAPPRIQLDPPGKHWKCLHFQCSALLRNNARRMRPGGQPKILTVIGKPSKTIGYSDISRSRDGCSNVKELEKAFLLIRLWFELRAIHTGILQKPQENKPFPSTLAGTRSTARNLGVTEEVLGKKILRPGIWPWWFHKAGPSPCYMKKLAGHILRTASFFWDALLYRAAEPGSLQTAYA